MQRLVHNGAKAFIKSLYNFDIIAISEDSFLILSKIHWWNFVKISWKISNATPDNIFTNSVNLINVNIILWPNLKGDLHGDSFYSDGFMCKICTMYHISSFLINGKFHLNELSSKLPRFSVLMWEVSDIRSTVLVSA